MKAKLIISIILVSFSMLTIISSCCKCPEKPKAVITILDENNQPVEGAEVTVYSEEGRVIYLADGSKYYDISTTDANGKVYYEFMYEAIYNVKASYIKGNGSSAVNVQGNGVLLLKENKTAEENIRLR